METKSYIIFIIGFFFLLTMGSFLLSFIIGYNEKRKEERKEREIISDSDKTKDNLSDGLMGKSKTIVDSYLKNNILKTTSMFDENENKVLASVPLDENTKENLKEVQEESVTSKNEHKEELFEELKNVIKEEQKNNQTENNINEKVTLLDYDRILNEKREIIRNMIEEGLKELR